MTNKVNHINFLNRLLNSNRDGQQASIGKESFKPFVIPNQGQLFKQNSNDSYFFTQLKEIIKSHHGIWANKTTMAVPLGFNVKGVEPYITQVGSALICECTDSKQLVINQFKKWRFPSVTFNQKSPSGADCYPYWAVLEFLHKLRKEKNLDSISSDEFMMFVTTIIYRRSIDNHIEALLNFRSLKSTLIDTIDKTQSTLLNSVKLLLERFSGDPWSRILAYDFFEHIEFDQENNEIKLINTKTNADFEAYIDTFYAKYSFPEYPADNSNYLKFLHNPDVKEPTIFLPIKRITKAMISELSGKIKNSFPFKNLLLKGVPGTGKSHTIEHIIDNDLFQLKDGEADHKCLSVSSLKEKNVLRINIHADSKNSELMQGVAVSTNQNNQIEYTEKQGLILNHIRAAILQPSLPFVIILEEIQENNLNRLIGDLIFLIEDSRRITFSEDYPDKSADDAEFISELTLKSAGLNKVILPSLVQNRQPLALCMPANLFVFCTSNFRDDKKIMEDNLLRRFEVIEIYPDAEIIKDKLAKVAKEFFGRLNHEIHKFFENLQETHPDRYQVGHASWMDVKNPKDFARALNKLVVDFKDVKELPWSYFKEIIDNTETPLPLDNYDYRKLSQELQDYYFFCSITEGEMINSIESLFSEEDISEQPEVQE
ncbi:AlwI family type II restriction endonuclease [Aliivibrio logei]|uniref:AAA+ ATPase domain-containing protein n=1 Tax=Aliivibrio logei 5S-186 TaxID=626086 RepID=A0ABX3AX40_ALILO|nr:AlwI family type II restriction endonuclease [Aliivibrio logei]OEF18988.1 hypothetical protein A1Q5_18550 [Aliivibrio logei 5S-186]